MEKKLWNTQYYLEERCGKQVVIPPIICGFVICQYHLCFELSVPHAHYLKKRETMFTSRYAEPGEGFRKGWRGKPLADEDPAGVRHLHHRLVKLPSFTGHWERETQGRDNVRKGLVQPAAQQHSPVRLLLAGQGKLCIRTFSRICQSLSFTLLIWKLN